MTQAHRGDGAVTANGILEWLRPRWSVVLFWTIDLATKSRLAKRSDVAEFGPGADPDTIVSVAHALNLTATEAASRMARGAHCLTLRVAGEIASTCWVSSTAEWLGEIEQSFVPEPGAAYVWDCATKPIYRGRHLYPELLEEILRRLSVAGYRRAWIATEWKNWRSARGVRRSGFQPVAVVVTISWAGLRLVSVIPNARAEPKIVAELREGLQRQGQPRQLVR